MSIVFYRNIFFDKVSGKITIDCVLPRVFRTELMWQPDWYFKLDKFTPKKQYTYFEILICSDSGVVVQLMRGGGQTDFPGGEVYGRIKTFFRERCLSERQF